MPHQVRLVASGVQFALSALNHGEISYDFGGSLTPNSFSRNGSKSPPDGHPLPRGHLIWVIYVYQKSLWAVLPQSPIYLLALFART
jgi:hypothetical protein